MPSGLAIAGSTRLGRHGLGEVRRRPTRGVGAVQGQLALEVLDLRLEGFDSGRDDEQGADELNELLAGHAIEVGDFSIEIFRARTAPACNSGRQTPESLQGTIEMGNELPLPNEPFVALRPSMMTQPGRHNIIEKMNSKNIATNAAFWGLPPPVFDPVQLARLRARACFLNWGPHSIGTERLNIAALVAASASLHANESERSVPSPYGFLALVRLKRSTNQLFPNFYVYNNLAKAQQLDEKYFHLDQPGQSIATELLGKRRGNMIKSMLAECPAPLMLCRSWDGSDMPSAAEAANVLLQAAAESSADACRALYTDLESRAIDKPGFRRAVAEAARKCLDGVWLSRPGLANRTERLAVAQCSFAFDRLAKKKALPEDLKEAAAIVETKRLAMAASESAPFAFVPDQLRRMRTILVSAEMDDAAAFAALAPLCGLDAPEAYESGLPVEAQVSHSGRCQYWTTRLVGMRAWRCASIALDLGDNPWLCSGDGPRGAEAKGNPFTLLADIGSLGQHGRQSFQQEGHSQFALSFARAALRDAESREPGRGLARCVESFEESRSARPDLWSRASSSLALVACERELIPAMIRLDGYTESEQEEPAPAPSSRRARL